MTKLDLSVQSLTKSYGRVTATADVSFDVKAGEIMSLLGPSGCGKTTTLRIIVGLVKPTRGKVIIKGRDVTNLPVHKRSIGMLFQNYALFPHLTVSENLAFGLKLRSLSTPEIARRVKDILTLVNLSNYGDRNISQLSGGQQQRVALARALVIQPDLLLLDEPFGALDRKLRERMQIEMKGLQARLGITTILVTHDQEEAMTLSDRIVVMNEGRIEQIGPPGEIYERPETAFVADFIGVSNLFPGVLVSAGAAWQVVTDDGAVLSIARLARDFAEGTRVVVAVRPENIKVSSASEQGDFANAIDVMVEQAVYRGSDTCLYLKRPNGKTLIASCRSGAAAALRNLVDGNSLRAHWRPESNHVISATI